MTDFLRALQPQIMSLFWFIVVLLIIFYFVHKYVGPEIKKYVRIGFFIILSLGFFGFCYYAINFAAVNEIPRSSIDRSAADEGVSNFEEKMKEDASKAKVETSSGEKKDSTSAQKTN